MYWKIVKKTDTRARALADRHYSRQTIGATEFCPPGNSIVLLGLHDDALWVSHRPDPAAALEQRRADGFDYYDNPYFRNESDQRASTLIKQALAVTMYLWRDYWPPDGFHSFVNPRKVKPQYGVYGWVFKRAGFELWPDVTKERQLLRYVYSLEKMRRVEPQSPMIEAPLFGLMTMADLAIA